MGLLIGAGVTLLVLVGVGLLYWSQSRGAEPVLNEAIGYATKCVRVPPFTRRLGFGQTAVLDTQSRTIRGLILYEPGSDGQPAPNPPPYQHPSWSSAGYLSPLNLDRDGAAYVAPVPWISTLYNPPGARQYDLSGRSADGGDAAAVKFTIRSTHQPKQRLWHPGDDLRLRYA